MKKFTLLSLCVLSSIYAFGQTGTVVLSERDKDALNQGHRNDIPVVTYNDSTISITSDSTIINSHVVIRNMFGGVLYQATTDLGQNQTVISLSEQDNKTKHSIELYCDDKYLQGFFENE